jgi:hypothetical protein
MADDVQRDLGKHEADIERLKEDVAAMRADLHTLTEMFAELRGGKKAVGILVGAAATMGAFLGWLASVFHFKPDGLP